MGDKSKSSGSGGSSNEWGSLHRAGVAAVLASHGLTGAPFGGAAGQVPVAIALETDDAVDDLVVTMEGGSRWFIQAKRTANRGAVLNSALEQWTRQDFDPGDSLVLAVRNATGMHGRAGEALDLRRGGREGVLPPQLKTDLNTFRTQLQALAGSNTDAILAVARIISIDAETTGERAADTAAARLESTIVPPKDGAAAFAALRAFFQTAAATRLVTRPADWIQALVNAGLEVILDPAGAPGAAAAARSAALADYRATVAGGLDILSLGAICPQVPTLTVPDFLDQVEVSLVQADNDRGATKLANAIRRNRRFVIRGYPGAGKSEAMRQAAAWLASDPSAPLPILVKLGELASKVATAADLTTDTIVGLAMQAQGRDSPELRSALLDAVQSGHCVVLADGLDEAHEKRGTVANGLHRLLAASHPDLGFVLTTRASAEDVVDQLSLPLTQLQPMSRSTTPIALLKEFAKDRPAGEQDSWLEDRRAVYRAQSEAHRDIWEVPLLATLATVRVARGDQTASTAAELLHGVVQSSVSNWVVGLSQDAANSPPTHFDAQMLTDGFAALGRLLNSRTGVTPVDGTKAVKEALGGWELPPRAVQAVADFIMDFWDNRVGVFIERDGLLQARSRQFAELGDAIFALSLDSPDEKTRWLEESLRSPGRITAVELATSGDLDAAHWLVEAALSDEHIDRRTLAASWAADFAARWSHADDTLDLKLIDMLSAAIAEPLPYAPQGSDQSGIGGRGVRKSSSYPRDGLGWHYAVTLASLRVSDSTSAALEAALKVAPVPDDRRPILEGLRVFSRRIGKGPLDVQEVALVEAALSYPLPATSGARSEYDKFGTLVISGGTAAPLYGMGSLAVATAPFAGQLSGAAIDTLWQIGRHSSVSTYGAVERQLHAAGFANPHPLRFPALDVEVVAEMRSDLSGQWLLSAIANSFPDDEGPTSDQSWRLIPLADVFDLMRVGESAMRGASSVSSSLVASLVKALVLAGEVNGNIAGTQARELLTLDDAEEFMGILYSQRFVRPERDDELIPASDYASLLGVVAHANSWMSFTAFEMLYDRRDPEVGNAARELDSSRWRNRLHLGWLRGTNAPNQEKAVKAMLTESTAYRVAAANIVCGEDVAWCRNAVLLLLEDEDGTVRAHAGATLEQVEKAIQWTCVMCGEVMTTGVYACSRCNVSSITSIAVHEELRRRERVSARESSQSFPGSL